MRTKLVTGLAAASLALCAGTSARAQSYPNAVQALNPAGYWPLNETAAAPTSPLNITAANSGTLGAAGNGYYGAWYQPNGTGWYITNNIVLTAGATGDGSQALLCQSGTNGSGTTFSYPGQYVLVPHYNNGVYNPNVTIQPPFSVELWVNPASINGANRTLVTQGGERVAWGNTNAWAGFTLGMYQDYIYLMVMSTNGYSKGSELDLSGYNKYQGVKVGQWYHVVATFDGTTETIFTNGVQAVSKTAPLNSAGLRYVPDTSSPLVIGAANVPSPDGGANTPWSGGLDDVAIYTNALSLSQIAAHYSAAAGGTYSSTVLADAPAFYYRFDDGQSQTSVTYTASSYPVAANAGSLGAAANGAYEPGTVPGMAGPSYTGFGANSKAVGINGYFGAVDVGAGALPAALNPTGTTNPLTIVSWFRGNPADAPGRFQIIAGHSDSSYRLGMGTLDGENHFNPGPGPELQFANNNEVNAGGWMLNDGLWHMVAGVCDGTNEYMYLDGLLVKSNSNPAGINIVGSTQDLLLGGDPQYTIPNEGASKTLRYFNGQIAQAAFWTNALSASQISGLYAAASVPPVIVTQPGPASQTLYAGTNFVISTLVHGGQPFTYQWYHGSTMVGTNGPSYGVSSLGLSDPGTYYAVISNGAGSVTSSIVTLTVIGPPSVASQSPTDIKVFAGTTPTLYVAGTGPSLGYQWSHNGSPVSGATASSYTLPAVSIGSSTYSCTISNAYGTATTTTITVAGLSAPAAPYPSTVLADHPVDYYRLDETSGAIAYDYAGGLNATYTNAVTGQPGYTSAFSIQSDPNETSTYFGSTAADSYAGQVPFLSFGTANGGNGAFSVEAWVSASGLQSTDAGVVALGYGGGGEQFDLDCGGADPKHNLRWIVRNAAGTASVANGTFAPADSAWHHVVGVCDEAHSIIVLYVDGISNASASISAGSGILAATVPMSIGSRESAKGTAYDNQFNGYIDDVSLYNYALSSTQVLNHYLSAGIAPVFVNQGPSTVTTNERANVTITTSVIGTAPITYYWQVSDGSGTHDITGVNSPSLTLTNITSAMNGNFYQVTASNIYGVVQSYGTVLNVNAGPPQLVTDISPLYAIAYTGTPFTYSVEVSGTGPFFYQWTLNGNNIANATNSSYSFNSILGTNAYTVSVRNAQGPVSPTPSIATNIGILAPTLNPASYPYKAKITFAGYNKGESLMNFPALVRFGTNMAGFDYSQVASPTGGDIRFTDASGTREIPSEIDEWNPNGTSSAWVSVPSLSSTNDYIWAYWGNANATTPEAWSTNGGVWVPPAFAGQPGYEAVYHLKENAFPFVDSTTMHTSTNGVAPVAGTGIIGTGAVFNGGDWLDAGTNDVGGAFTLSAWVNVNTSAYSIKTLWANQHGGYGSPGFALQVNSYNTSDGQVVFDSGPGGSGEIHTGSGSVSYGQWHLVEAAVNLTNGTVAFYVDGANIQTSSGLSSSVVTLADLRLGIFTDNNFGFLGTMDEARVRGTTSDANWIWADYMTVAQNSTFENYGAVAGVSVKVTAQRVGGNLVLTWPSGTLQSATSVNGPWTTLNSATSPCSVPVSGSSMFFRVKVQ